MPVIRISDTLYARLGKIALGFDTPANVIEKLLNEHEGVVPVETEIVRSTKKITQDVIERTYSLAKDVYAQTMSIADAQAILVDDLKMHDGSARDYINNFQKMMAGECYQRTMNGAATEYYLKNIHSDFERKYLKKALSAVEQHIEYYEQFSNGKLQNIRKIHERFSKLI